MGCFKDGICHGSFNTSTARDPGVLWPLRRTSRMARILEKIWPNLHSPRTYHWTSSQRKPIGQILDQLEWSKHSDSWDTVDGQNPKPVEVGSLSHYLQGFIHTRRLFGISSINSMCHINWLVWVVHQLYLFYLLFSSLTNLQLQAVYLSDVLGIGVPSCYGKPASMWNKNAGYQVEFRHQSWSYLCRSLTIRVFPKIGGKTPKMDGENNGNALLRWMIWWNPLFSETSTYHIHIILDLIIYTCMLCVFILDFVSFVWSTEDYVQYMCIYIHAYMYIKNVMNWFIATSPCWDDWNSWDVFFMWQ